MIFQYRAIDSSGVIKEDIINASDKVRAVKMLTQDGLKVLSIESLSSENSKVQESKVKLENDKIGEKIAIVFFKKMLQLCGSGAMPVGDALKSLASRSLDPKIKSLGRNLYKDISEGKLLANAMEHYPKAFDSCVCRLVEVGESTANLSFVFKNIIKYLQDRQTIRKNIISALAYPVFLCIMACAVVVLFLFFMLPKIKLMMTNMGAEENFPIVMMTCIGNILTYGVPILLTIIFLLSVFIKFFRKSKEGRLKFDEFILKIPLISKLVVDAETSRFSSLCATLFASGVNATDAFYMTEKSIKNLAFKEKFKNFRIMVNDGVSIPLAIQRFGLLSDEDIDVLSVGEKTGSLANAFSEISQIRAENLERNIKTLTALSGGIALATAFILVFIFAMGIVLSILGLSQSISA